MQIPGIMDELCINFKLFLRFLSKKFSMTYYFLLKMAIYIYVFVF